MAAISGHALAGGAIMSCAFDVGDPPVIESGMFHV